MDIRWARGPPPDKTFIRRAKTLDPRSRLSANLLKPAQNGRHCSKVKAIAQCRVADMSQPIGQLQAIRAMLMQHVEHCLRSGVMRGRPIIAALAGDSGLDRGE